MNMLILQAATQISNSSTPSLFEQLGGANFILTSLFGAISLLFGAWLKTMSERIKDSKEREQHLKEQLKNKEELYEKLVQWTKEHSEKTVVSYMSITNLLQKISEDDSNENLGKQISFEIDKLKLSLEKEFSNLKQIIESK